VRLGFKKAVWEGQGLEEPKVCARIEERVKLKVFHKN
jgi:hypothetical protein